jgi:hypothetical protein
VVARGVVARGLRSRGAWSKLQAAREETKVAKHVRNILIIFIALPAQNPKSCDNFFLHSFSLFHSTHTLAVLPVNRGVSRLKLAGMVARHVRR